VQPPTATLDRFLICISHGPECQCNSKTAAVPRRRGRLAAARCPGNTSSRSGPQDCPSKGWRKPDLLRRAGRVERLNGLVSSLSHRRRTAVVGARDWPETASVIRGFLADRSAFASAKAASYMGLNTSTWFTRGAGVGDAMLNESAISGRRQRVNIRCWRTSGAMLTTAPASRAPTTARSTRRHRRRFCSRARPSCVRR
jgi:hypothetical protein